MRWKKTQGIVFDSFKESEYIILITKNKEFNFLKNTSLEHIVLITERKTLISFLKYVVNSRKKIIYIKKSGTKDILAKAFDSIYDYTLIEYNSLSEEFDLFLKLTIESKIKSILREQHETHTNHEKVVEEEKDEELDIEDMELET